MKVITMAPRRDGAIREFHFKDDTVFEKDVPWTGWMRILEGDRTWWFNSDHVIAVVPSETYEQGMIREPVIPKITERVK